MLNPWIILAVVIAFVLAVAGAGYEGHKFGVASQKAEDQAQFDKYNADIAANKTKAATILAAANADNLALMAERDTLKTNLEKDHATHQAVTAAAAVKYSALSLRYSAAQAAGRGDGSGSPQSATADAAGAAPAPVLQLPDPIAGNLRQLTRDADDLNDDYTECYNYANKVR